MSTETLTKESTKNLNIDPNGQENKNSSPKISNFDLNKIYNNNLIKKKTKICINKLQEKLREKEVKQKSVTIRTLGSEKQETLSLDKAITKIYTY